MTARLVPRQRNDASGLTSDSQADPEEPEQAEGNA
jgi:hypothetical protein